MSGAGLVPTGASGAGPRDRWRVETVTGVAALHERPWPDPLARTVWVGGIDGATLVLGSTQDPAVVDPDGPAGVRGEVEVVRRRSGGGAVLLEPGRALWVDLLVPATDPLWQADVGRAMHWVGDAWAGALAACGVDVPVVHRGGLVHGPWSSVACFAGLGSGEVTSGGRKVVGIAQRRIRTGARFQCLVLLGDADPAGLAVLLRLPPDERRRLAAHLRRTVAVVPAAPATVLDALVHHLP